jgi:cell division protein FtsB
MGILFVSIILMARNQRNRGSRHRLDSRSNKMHARTERMHVGVRLCFCVLALMGCSAFMVAGLPHHRKLQKMKADLAEVHTSENEVVERVDAKARELRAIASDPQYRELIARDRLNYYKPGERVFRIERR